MRCHKAQRYISEYVDGTLDPGTARRLERHIATCRECRAVLGDFRALAGAARELDGPEPGDAVWEKIRAKVGLLDRNPAALPASMPGRARFLSGPSILKLAGALAVALLLVVSGVFIERRVGRKTGPEGLAEQERYTLAKLDEAEQHYQQAIKALAQAFDASKGGMPAQVADMFEKNLAVVDATIQACRQAVLREPEDVQARSYLLAAYMDKVSVLDTALEFQRRDASAGTRKKSL
jgi:hypothetical protein